jgi:hypothetical protein
MGIGGIRILHNPDVNAREGATLGVRFLKVGFADTFLGEAANSDRNSRN